jgi:hypothetical protein
MGINKKVLLSFILSISLFLALPHNAFAHQPKIPQTFPVIVDSPEISKAFYSKFENSPQIYKISSDKPFNLYAGILVPDIPNQSTDLFVTIIQKGKVDKKIAYLDGTKFKWVKMFEEFGHDNYLKGPEFKLQAPAGNYEISVSGKNSGVKYTLATGEVESFGFSNSMEVLSIIPILKVNFFNKSPIDFILSPIGGGYAAVLIVLSFVFGFVFSFVIRKFAKKKVRKNLTNIGTNDRLIRLGLAIAFFTISITTSWNGLLIFAAGFCLFEAVFSWCGLFAIMCKNTCSM